MSLPARSAVLVLVTPAGEQLGCLPPLEIATPWWQHTAPVLAAARARWGLELLLLRLLHIDQPIASHVLVTYLAEVVGERPPTLPLHAWSGTLQEHPLRLPYARVGGPAAEVAWADDALAQHSLSRKGPAEQIRTWNLSSVFRITLNDGTDVWLKAVPPFAAHEGRLLAKLAGAPVPKLLAHAGGRVLMRAIPGEDRYDADLASLVRMVRVLIELQAAWFDKTADLLALGARDLAEPALSAEIADTLARTELPPEVRARLTRFVDDLPRRFAALAECGLPDSLVHGDFHPGNFRGRGEAMCLLDWSDSGVGHPLLDQSAFLARVQPQHVPELAALWSREWKARRPGSDPERAARLLAPIAAARQAAIYRMFLDNIEPSEHPYHALDPADWLTRTSTLLPAAGL